MCEPSAKKILFNKATLLSLKAELLKKQEEIKEKKQLPQHKVENYKPPHRTSEQKASTSENKTKKSFHDRLEVIDAEELEACRKAKSALEKKAELYDHLSDSAVNSQLADRFLVDFKEKKQEATKAKPDEDTELEHDSDKNDFIEEDGDWVEFRDCLGRTRKCPRSDVEFYKKRDEELMKLMNKEQNTAEVEKPLLVQKTNDYLQSLREKWEQKEKELLGKDKDIHYQDLLFDEARIHGVGYYSFSTDENERRKQMDELLKQHAETLRAQKEAEEVRKKRDELVAARVAAARARQRARAGLPPEDPNENKKDFTTCLLELLTQQKNEADNKAKAEEKRLKEEREKERQKLREEYVREWDVGKTGVKDKINKFKEMTQEEYVDQQRSKRIKEFAPFEDPQRNDSGLQSTFDSSGKIGRGNDETVKTWADVRPRATTPPPPVIGDMSALEPQQKGLYFSSKKSETVVKYRNFVQYHEPTPIVNELSDNESEKIEKRKSEKRNLVSSHAEIEPPPTYDYYGPTPKQSRPQKPFDLDIRKAFAQGTKSLESKSSNARQVSKEYDFTFD